MRFVCEELRGPPRQEKDAGTLKACPPNRGESPALRKTRRAAEESLLVFGPGRDDVGHASVGHELAHVLVSVNDDAQVHAVDGGIAIDDVNLAFKVFACDR